MSYDIYKEVERLRKKHGKDRSLARTFPNLKVEQNVSPMSNGIGCKAFKKKENVKPDHLIVDILHKQGPMVISREDLIYAGGKKV